MIPVPSPLVILGAHKDDDPHRVAARNWIRSWWLSRGFAVFVATAAGRPWVKADAYNRAVQKCSFDVVILADADCLIPEEAARLAVDAVHAGAGWAVPFDTVHRLTPAATDTLLGQDPALTDQPAAAEQLQQHDATPGGGIVVMATDLAAECGPFDPRFAGWGGEDYALGLAAQTLSGRPATTVHGPLWHLWHPPQPRTPAGDLATDRLCGQYRWAKHRPDRMLALIDEGRTSR